MIIGINNLGQESVPMIFCGVVKERKGKRKKPEGKDKGKAR